MFLMKYDIKGHRRIYFKGKLLKLIIIIVNEIFCVFVNMGLNVNALRSRWSNIKTEEGLFCQCDIILI